MQDDNPKVDAADLVEQRATGKRADYRQPQLTVFGRVVKMTGSSSGSQVDAMNPTLGAPVMGMGMGMM